MGRPKGSKNKPKVVQHDTNVREMPATDSRSIGNVGISILELTEEIKVTLWIVVVGLSLKLMTSMI